MKFIRKLFLFILTTLLINLITALTFSFNFHKVIVDGVIKETIKTKINSSNFKEPGIIIDNEATTPTDAVKTTDERVNKILESKEIQNLVEEYLEYIMSSIDNPESIDNIDFENDIIKYLEENKDVIETATGVKIDDEMISNVEKEMQDKDVNIVVRQQVKNVTNNMSEEEKTVLKGYEFLISTKFKIILGVVIALNILLIALIQMSLHEWIKTTGLSILLSGIETIISSLVIQEVVKKLTGFTNFHTNPLLINGSILFIVGMVIVIIYKVIIKKLSKNKECNI